MLQPAEIDRIVNDAASRALHGRDLLRVFNEPTTDSEGREALRIVVVLEEGAPARIGGDSAVDAIIGIQRRLSQSGETRFPIVDFATEAELLHDGDR